MSENKAVIPATPTSIEAIDDELPQGLAAFEFAKQRFAVISKLRAFALRNTKAHHWTDEQGTPFLNSHGTDHVELAFGISSTVISKDKMDMEDEKGKYYLWTFVVRCQLPGHNDFVEAVGACSSRDRFLGTETRKGRSIDKVQETHIIKKAWTDARRTAIQRMFDLRGLTWDELKECGIDKAKCASVRYGGDE